MKTGDENLNKTERTVINHGNVDIDYLSRDERRVFYTSLLLNIIELTNEKRR